MKYFSWSPEGTQRVQFSFMFCFNPFIVIILIYNVGKGGGGLFFIHLIISVSTFYNQSGFCNLMAYLTFLLLFPDFDAITHSIF